MKVKHILVLLILGSTGAVLGALFKIQHWPGASVILMVSILLEVLGGILAVWKLLTIKDFTDFLNK
jgi:hypothetical protein